ncbi:MAG: iron-sulfur cluster assembly accessory protein [Alphaproteobacteria bacterium]|nr:iron-sulfur cluster assembly accessory protein [Alphaproteobacteria bacterium]
MQPVMSVTSPAVDRIKELLDGRSKPSAGIRIGTNSKGCLGMSYTLEFADQKEPNDDMVEQDGVTVFIDPKALMFMLGTELDFVSDGLQSGFVFNNPNEKGRCGCGQSFQV